VLARYSRNGKRYYTIRYHTKYRDTIRCINCNVKFNALRHGRQFINERLLLRQRLRAWLVQQDDDRSKTADTGTCADDLKRGRLISNVDRRQCDIGIGENGDAAVVDRQGRQLYAVAHDRRRCIKAYSQSYCAL